MNDLAARVEDFFKPAGLLCQKFPGFEYRPEQMQMAMHIVESFSENRIYLVEAGTGVGKSFAYLIPALLWSRQENQRVVISTFTINLQEQLVKKDLPQMLDYLDLKAKAVLVKGWGNYLCRRKIHFLPRKSLNFSERAFAQLKRILDWLGSHPMASFSFSDLPFQVAPELREEISCEADLCPGKNCPFYQGCAFHLARAEMESANLLILNHALLVCDLALQKENAPGIIPPYTRLIVDEAHHLEEVACEYLGTELQHPELPKILRQLLSAHPEAEGGETGFLPLLRTRLLNSALPQNAKEYFKNNLDYLLFQLPALKEVWEEFFIMVKQNIKQQRGEEVPPFLQIKPEIQATPDWEILSFAREKLGNILGQFAHRFFTLKDELLQLPQSSDGEFEQILTDVDAYLKRLLRIREKLEFVFAAESEDYAFWLEAGEKKPRIRAIPYRVGDLLKEQLFSKLESGILTSATLAVKKDFSFIKSRLGLEETETREIQLPSSFNYKKQSALFIPHDLPGPEEAGFSSALREALPPLLAASRGRAFVLFTSYSLLKKAAEFLKETLSDDFALLVQGETPRHRMLEAFKTHPYPVLLGTDSFWEGVDVPGEALSLVVITRLPFKAPEDPVVLAQVEMMEKEGLNSFWQLMLPRAVLKLKQGFGRLIRQKTDRGAVVILDKRVLTKTYGNTFLSSLPNSVRETGKWADLWPKVGDFLRG